MESGNGLEIRPFTAGFGAEILGVDLSSGVDEETLRLMKKAFGEYGVIFFREQNLTPGQHLAFAEEWAPINVNRFFRPVEGHPRIAEVRKEPDQKINIGGGWHTDHSYDVAPAMGSMLYAREVPQSGGDTLFANLALAYESLSDGLKKTLEGMRAVHSSRHVFGNTAVTQTTDAKGDLAGRIGNADAATQDVVHPVVIRHPDTGRKILYVNPGFTLRFDGWTRAESKPLLSFLYEQATVPERTIRFRWREGSIALWDNRTTWHYALNDYNGERRLMHRITLEGVPVEAAA